MSEITQLITALGGSGILGKNILVDFFALFMVVGSSVAIVLKYVNSKQTRVDNNEAQFYNHLTLEHERLIALVRSLQEGKAECFEQLFRLKSEIATVASLEREIKDLQVSILERDEILNKRNTQIDKLVAQLLEKNNQIVELTRELKMLKSEWRQLH